MSAVPARVPVQGSLNRHSRKYEGAGSIAWEEHVEAWNVYAKLYGKDQSAVRIAERGGFSYREIVDHLGRQPRTWTAEAASSAHRVE